MSPNFVWMIEKGTRMPSERTISDICRIFNVSEDWVRTGEGDMFLPRSRHDEIAEFMRDLTYLDDDDFKVRFISMLANLDESRWVLLEAMAQKLLLDENEKGQA